MDPGSTVEVCLRKDSHCWSQGRIRDVDASRGRVLVCFEADDTWDLDVESSQVRSPPPKAAKAEHLSWVPKRDEAVEVLRPPGPHRPQSWWRGVVRMARSSFFYVSPADNHRDKDVIARRDQLRPVNREPTLDQQRLFREVVQVDLQLTSWVASEDAVGCLAHVRTKAGLLNACCQLDEEEAPIITLLGDANSVDLGRKLLCEVHLKHQAEIRRCHEKVMRLQDRLMDYEEHSRDLRLEFGCEDNLIGRLIGKNRHNLNRVQDQFNVRVQVLDRRPPNQPSKRIVHIIGQDTDQVEAARRELEYVQVSMHQSREQRDWILGPQGFAQMKELAREASLIYARFNPDKESLELCGLKDNVALAQSFIEDLESYRRIHVEMRRDKILLKSSFDQLKEAELRQGKKGKKGGGKSKTSGPMGFDPGAYRGCGAGPGGGASGGRPIGSPPRAKGGRGGKGGGNVSGYRRGRGRGGIRREHIYNEDYFHTAEMDLLEEEQARRRFEEGAGKGGRGVELGEEEPSESGEEECSQADEEASEDEAQRSEEESEVAEECEACTDGSEEASSGEEAGSAEIEYESEEEDDEEEAADVRAW